MPKLATDAASLFGLSAMMNEDAPYREGVDISIIFKLCDDKNCLQRENNRFIQTDLSWKEDNFWHRPP